MPCRLLRERKHGVHGVLDCFGVAKVQLPIGLQAAKIKDERDQISRTGRTVGSSPLVEVGVLQS